MKNLLFTNEEILPYDFVKSEVLKDSELIQRRKDNLYMALILGRNYNKVARINALSTEGKKQIEGVVLAITEEYVILKGGTKIPVCCIEETRIY